MAKIFRIKCKQRWQYTIGNNIVIAEVIYHSSPSSEHADMRIKQVIKGTSFYKNQWLYSVYPIRDNGWVYLEGQDKP